MLLQLKTMALQIVNLKSLLIILLLLFMFSMTAVSSLLSSAAADKITLLPGQPQVNFQQFSGYVTVNNDDHHKKQKSLFYYFVEAQVDPMSKPLVLWLNGGIHIYIYTYIFYTNNSVAFD